MSSNRQSALAVVRRAYPHLERELTTLHSGHLGALLSASKKRWTVEKIKHIWFFAPSPGTPPTIKATDDGLAFMGAKDFID